MSPSFFSTELPRLVVRRDLGSVYRRLLRLGRIQSRIFVLWGPLGFNFLESWMHSILDISQVPRTVFEFPFLQLPVPYPSLKSLSRYKNIIFFKFDTCGSYERRSSISWSFCRLGEQYLCGFGKVGSTYLDQRSECQVFIIESGARQLVKFIMERRSTWGEDVEMM